MRTKWRDCLLKAIKPTDQPKKIVRCHLAPAERHGRTCAQGGAGPGPGRCRRIWKGKKKPEGALKISAVGWHLSLRTVHPWKGRQVLLKQLKVVFLPQKWCIWKHFGEDRCDFGCPPCAGGAVCWAAFRSSPAGAVQPFRTQHNGTLPLPSPRPQRAGGEQRLWLHKGLSSRAL